MAINNRFLFDETKFRPGQQKAALLLVERDFVDKKDRKTQEEIAEECGVTRVTLWNWDKKDANFIAYKNYLASEMMNSQLSFVYSKLMDIIGEGNTKGIEMFLKRIGDLDTKSDVTINDKRGGDEASFDERKSALLERLGLAGGESEEESETSDKPRTKDM